MTVKTDPVNTTGELTQRKKYIYERAARLFRDKGFPATSMRDLASAVGIEASSLYSHIDSKAEILRHICFNCAGRFLEELEEINNSTVDPSEKLRALIDSHVSIAQEDATSIIVFNDEWRHLEEPYLAEFVNLRRTYEEGCVRIIKEGISDGSFRNIDPFIVLNSMLSSTLWIHRSARAHEWTHSEISGQIADMVLFGLKLNVQ